MSGRLIAAAEFEATCMTIIDQMKDDGQPVIVTKGGEPIALVTPIGSRSNSRSLIGALKGSVDQYRDPFSPAIDPQDWSEDWLARS